MICQREEKEGKSASDKKYDERKVLNQQTNAHKIYVAENNKNSLRNILCQRRSQRWEKVWRDHVVQYLTSEGGY